MDLLFGSVVQINLSNPTIKVYNGQGLKAQPAVLLFKPQPILS